MVADQNDFAGIKYRRVAKVLKELDELGAASGHHLRLLVHLERRKGKTGPDPIQEWAVHDGKEEAIETAGDGYFYLPFRQDWVDADAKIVSNQPKGSMRADLVLEVMVRDGQPIPYAEMRQGAKLLDRAIERLVGPVLGFVIPGIDQFSFQCGPKDHCRLEAALEGEPALEHDDNGAPLLDFNSRLERRNPSLRLTASTDNEAIPAHIYALPVAHLF
ncbi:hypothetical protein UCD39_17110 [Nitrospirillum sp. BR 11752]|uniref:hypothetical protein n=1 Tax=Nitrospirillum sp. BR 11752 TaxID=3104293 RepID=UPI002ECE5FEF|nr:hypothetical protein [Nitrospirillum sp. BR 11752]